MVDRTDFAALGEKTLADLIVTPPLDASEYIIRMTSGTSGVPIVIATGYPAEAPAQAGGSTAEEQMQRMLVCMGSLNGRFINVLLVRRGSAKSTMRVLALDPKDLDKDLIPFLLDWKPDSVHGFPSFISRLAPFCDGWGSLVKVVKLTGERVSNGASQLFSAMFVKAKQIEIYIAVEIGGRIGEQCGYLPKGHFHPSKGVQVEIVGKDENGIGDLLISKRLFRSINVERYRIGDVGRFVEGVCRCGQAVAFELVGRKGIDYVKVAGALARREEFDRATLQFPDLIDDYRALISETHRENGLRGKIAMKIFRKKGPVTDALARELAERLSKALFLTPTRTLSQLVESGEFERLSIEYVERPFVEGHKDVRLILQE